jgi:hypothetical protein
MALGDKAPGDQHPGVDNRSFIEKLIDESFRQTGMVSQGAPYGFPHDVLETATWCSIRETEATRPKDLLKNVNAAVSNFQASLPTTIPRNFEDAESTFNQVANNTPFNTTRIGLDTTGTYYLPMPMMGLQEEYNVNYNDGFQYLPGADVFNPRGGGGLRNLAGIPAAALGLYVNTFKSITLNSPTFRRFSLKWKLSPQNAGESRTIQKIIHRIRKGMTPSVSANKLLFQFPHIYWVGFKNAEWTFKTKPSVITKINVDYAGGQGVPSFYQENVAPESVLLDLHFIELEYWIREDLQNDQPNNPDTPSRNAFDPSILNFYRSGRGR